MKAYLCSIGEPTTEICKKQLEKYGLEVVMLDAVESWEEKYKRFIGMASENCIRIDADIIPNGNAMIYVSTEGFNKETRMIQFKGYDFYQNNLSVMGLVYYSKEALEEIRASFDKIDWRRPEATAWRLPKINRFTETIPLVCGIHGFFQSEEDLERHMRNKEERKQMENYDFELARELLNLKYEKQT